MLPHLRDRPLTLVRFPDGVDGAALLREARPRRTAPSGSAPRRSRSAAAPATIEFVVCDDLPTLVWLAQLAALELHPSLALADRPRAPDGARLRPRSRRAGDVVECCAGGAAAARAVRRPRARVLPEDLGLEGDAGLRAAQRGRDLRAHQALRPRRRAGARARRARPRRLADGQGRCAAARCFVDWSQNDRTKTTVAVYSLRGRERADGLDPAALGRGRAAPPSAGDPDALRFEAAAVLERVERARRPVRRRCSSSSRSCPTDAAASRIRGLARRPACGWRRPRRGGAPASCRAPGAAISGSSSASARIASIASAKRVERLAGLGLGRLDHQRLVDEQREVDRRRVEAVVEQPLGDVERLHPELALGRLAGEHELVHRPAVEGRAAGSLPARPSRSRASR